MATLNGILGDDLARKLGDLDLNEVSTLVKATSLGLKPQALYSGIQTIAGGEEVPLPTSGGSPKPVTVNAWSFVKDTNQYSRTYGLSSARAGELMDLLRSDADKGISEIHKVVSEALTKKGSTRPVNVSREGMPGVGSSGQAPPPPGRQGGAELKTEIKRDSARYGMYKFKAEDTGKDGAHRFGVRLGGGLYSLFPNKSGAVDIARIARVHGRQHALCQGRVAFCVAGRPPVFGGDIPEKVTFDGRLSPGDPLPADPVPTAKTISPSPPPQRTPKSEDASKAGAEQGGSQKEK